MNNDNKELVVAAHNLPENKTQDLLKSYADSFSKAKLVVEKAKNIKVTAEDQLEEMKEARSVRLELKDIRVHVENTRVELKEQSLREGKAIDGMANIIKALIVPVEQYLEKQEKFAEEQKKAREEDELQRRTEILTPYVVDVSVYELHPTKMSKETFENLLNTSKTAWEATKAAEKKAEDDKKAEELKKEKENEKIRKDNVKLQEKLDIERKAKREAEKKELEAQEKLRKEKEEQARKERDAKLAEEAKFKAEADAKRKAELAPDIEKMRVIYTDMRKVATWLELVKLTDPNAQAIASKTKEGLEKVMAVMAEEIRNL